VLRSAGALGINHRLVGFIGGFGAYVLCLRYFSLMNELEIQIMLTCTAVVHASVNSYLLDIFTPPLMG